MFRMPPDKAIAARSRQPAAPYPYFTVARANRTLVLVRKIVADIVARYTDLKELQHQRERLANVPGHAEQIETLDRRQEGCAADLNALNQELAGIGCVLKDWGTGLVDFPAQHGGRRVWLCWRLGEPAVSYWHDREEGVAGRKVIGRDWTERDE
jgi:hypothetical protein